MPLFHVAVLALLAGVTEALPVSPSGHDVVARLWLDSGAMPVKIEAFAALGAALGLVAAARRRLAGALHEGVRAVARPALFGASLAASDALVLLVGSVVSLIVSLVTWPRVAVWSASPTATGLGLCASGLALASTVLVARGSGPENARRGPSLGGATIVGIAHGLAVFPGASRVGAALTVLLWIGVRPARAVDLAFLLTAPALLATFVRDAHAGVGTTTIALTVALAFLGAAAASEVLRNLAPRRRIAALALWTLPLGLAMLAYARALPHVD
ncbi:Undecaprenyl-diphosphatase [Minicystis rosea]|nr:Undecaprenyl-diphosphatase [Minicystis rosea]